MQGIEQLNQQEATKLRSTSSSHTYALTSISMSDARMRKKESGPDRCEERCVHTAAVSPACHTTEQVSPAPGRGERQVGFCTPPRYVDELISEFALAHVEGPATVAAYARDEFLEERRPVMQRWADCVLP